MWLAGHTRSPRAAVLDPAHGPFSRRIEGNHADIGIYVRPNWCCGRFGPTLLAGGRVALLRGIKLTGCDVRVGGG